MIRINREIVEKVAALMASWPWDTQEGVVDFNARAAMLLDYANKKEQEIIAMLLQKEST